MSIVRWSPFREMETMHNEMNRLFSLFGGFSPEQSRDNRWMLPVDVIETNDALKLRASLPGVSPKDVNIEINDNVLTITAERHQEDKGHEGNYQWIEQQYGTFSRSLTLPRSVDTQKIEARYRHGVLELNVPKIESAKPRRITLQTDEQDTRTFEATMSGDDMKQLQTSETPTSRTPT